jgi:hypothetical protein
MHCRVCLLLMHTNVQNVLPLCARLTEQCERVHDACVLLCALTTTALRSMLSQAKMMRDSTRRKPLHCKGVFLHVTDEASADHTNMMVSCLYLNALVYSDL